MSWVIKQLHAYHTFLGDRQNYQPQGAVGHFINYLFISLGGPQHLGADNFVCCPERYEIVVY